MAHAMWSGERGTEQDFDGRQVHASRLLNVPQSISRPRVPIMIGGGGARRTLRLVAQYADASNLFGGPDQLLAKYAILAEHCEAVGRPFEEIERSSLQQFTVSGRNAWGAPAESPDQLVERFGRPAEAGVHTDPEHRGRQRSGRTRPHRRAGYPQLRDLDAADPRRAAAPAAGVARQELSAEMHKHSDRDRDGLGVGQRSPSVDSRVSGGVDLPNGRTGFRRRPYDAG
jgi:alkanesulfonate monooxygenase SsuD/methylene tetrahydromethanopterin reductase-like flavin-dependent oxidoreductase (luciferase family)